jgi:hypothetical protein
VKSQESGVKKKLLIYDWRPLAVLNALSVFDKKTYRKGGEG